MAHTDNNLFFCDLDNDLTDDSGNGVTFTDHGTVTYNGTAASFNGTNQWLSCANQLNGRATCTIAFWSNWAGSGDRAPLGEGIPGSSGDLFWENTPRLFFWGAGGNQDNTPTQIASGLHSYVLVRTATTVKVYKDGSLSDNFSNASVGNIADVNSGSSPFNIGRSPSGSGAGTLYFNGTFQDFAVYSDAKDATWASDEYNAGTPKKWADWAGGGAVIVPFNLFQHSA